MMRFAVLSLGLAALSGCGFTPAYAPLGETADGSAIRIPEIDGRTGHFLRQELVRYLGRGVPGAENAGQLDVQMKEGVNFVGYQPDEAASRADYVASADWRLMSTDGVQIAGGNVREAASFNFAGYAYNDVAAQTAAKERVALALARAIRQDLLLQLRMQSAAAERQEATPPPMQPAPAQITPSPPTQSAPGGK